MEWLMPSLIAALTSTLMLAGVYGYLYTIYRRPFLLIWSISWGISATRFLIQLVELPARHSTWPEIAIQIAALVSGVLLLVGLRSYEQRPMGKIWYAISTALFAWSLAEPFTSMTHQTHSLPNFIFLAIVNFAVGATIFRMRNEVGFAAVFTSIVFFAWGAHKLNYPFLADSSLFAPWGFLLGSILALSAAIGMLLIYFEKNRRALSQSETSLLSALEAVQMELQAREQTDQAMQQAKKDWERTFDAVPDLIAILDTSHRVMRCNRALALRLEISPAEIINLRCHEVIHGSATPPPSCPHAHLLQDGMEHQGEQHIPQLGGWFEVTATPLLDETGLLIGSVHIAHDITERVLLRQQEAAYQVQLQALAHTQNIAQERERKRLATLLHDQIGQNLALTKIKLGMLHGEIIGQPLAIRTAELQKMLSEIIDSTRSLTVEISPPALYQMGLGAALESLADTFRNRFGLDLTVTDTAGEIELNEVARIIVYQAVRELAVNILKHAQVRRGTIALHQTDQRLVITVSDEGIGISSTSAEQKQSFGLFSIREQLATIGGKVVIASNAATGTRVTIELPHTHTVGGKDGSYQGECW